MEKERRTGRRDVIDLLKFLHTCVQYWDMLVQYDVDIFHVIAANTKRSLNITMKSG